MATQATGSNPGTFSNLVQKGANAIGNLFLGKGTNSDATAETQDAYRKHVEDAQANGDPAMNFADFVKSLNPTKTQ